MQLLLQFLKVNIYDLIVFALLQLLASLTLNTIIICIIIISINIAITSIIILSLKCKISAIWLVERACMFVILLIDTVQISKGFKTQKSDAGYAKHLNLY